MSDTQITEYGFNFGPAVVTRICSDPRYGVWLTVAGKREEIEVRVTRGGKLRVGNVKKRKPTP